MPTSSELKPFRSWLLENGRSHGTARLYCINVERCLSHEDGVTARLVGKLAPKTKRTNLAALRSYADFTDDQALVKRLKRIKLPPADRVKTKVHLEVGDWQKVIAAVRTVRMSAGKRAALLIICLRGLRCADVLRLRRKDVVEALRTGRLSGETKGQKRIEWTTQPIKEALETLAAIDDWEEVTDLVVPKSMYQDPYLRRHSAVTKLGKAMAKVADHAELLGVHPHRLRRTYATHFVFSLKDDPRAILKLQKHMGWSDMTTAASYVDAVNREELDTLGETMMAGVTGVEAEPARRDARRR